MPLRSDERRRWVEMEWVLPATREQAWEAVATGPGYAAWFLPAEIEPRVGGTLRFDFGEGVSSQGEVTAWEPPHRFAYLERDWDTDVPPLHTEVILSSRKDGGCLMRMSHVLETTEET